MNQLTFERYQNKAEAIAAAGEELNRLLASYKTVPVLLLLSGGSALFMLDYVSKNNTGEFLTISMLDERFSEDKEVNNFLQMQKMDFYSFALETETSFF